MALDSARQNLASSFVNSFVNAAFGTDKLLTEDGNKWIYKNKEHGKQKETFDTVWIGWWDLQVMGYNINKNKKRQVQKDMCIIIILDAPFFG